MLWDPEVILFAPNSMYEYVADDPLWQNMTAIQNGRYYEVPYPILAWQTGAVDHDWTDATCTEAKTCTICGQTEGEALGHDHQAVYTEHTCMEDGYTTYTCECGDSYIADETAALGHDYVDGTCSHCGEADPDYEEPSSGNWWDKWFGSWWGDDEDEDPTEPSVPETSEPTDPSDPTEPTEPEEDEDTAPGWGGWFDWIWNFFG